MSVSLAVRSVLVLLLLSGFVLLTVTHAGVPPTSAIESAISGTATVGVVLPTPPPVHAHPTVGHQQQPATAPPQATRTPTPTATATPRPVVIPGTITCPSCPNVPGYIFFTYPDHNLGFITGRHVRKQFTGDGSSVAPAFSPNSHLLAWVLFKRNFSDIEITSLGFGANGSVTAISTTALTQDESPPPALKREQSYGYDPRYEWWANKPSWLPDGQHLLYLSDRPGFTQANATDVEMRVWEQGLADPVANAVSLSSPGVGTGGDDSPAWRPGDPSAFIYVDYNNGGPVGATSQGVIEAAGAVTSTGLISQPVDLTPAGRTEYHPAWSPDGNYIAFIEDTGNNSSNLKVMPFHAPGNPIDYTHAITVAVGAPFVSQPFWSPDGKWLGYLTGGSGDFSLVIRRAHLGVSPPRFDAPITVVQAGAVSADYRPTWGM